MTHCGYLFFCICTQRKNKFIICFYYFITCVESHIFGNVILLDLPTEREMDLWAELQATKETLRITEDEVTACKREKVRFLETLTKITVIFSIVSSRFDKITRTMPSRMFENHTSHFFYFQSYIPDVFFASPSR